MCGIFGYYNYNQDQQRAQILQLLFNGLHRLEYRGYDSAGLAVDTKIVEPHNNTHISQTPQLHSNGHNANAGATSFGNPIVIKSLGKVNALEKLVYSTCTKNNIDLTEIFSSHVGIAHTRWATHGAPSPKNSHPISSDDNHEFMVVHNGIITNYVTLKEFLIKEGEKFTTETDTEVIPKLCRYVYNQLEEAVLFSSLVMKVIDQLEGAFALVIKSVHYPGEMVACKRGSPMIFGIRDNGVEGRASSPERIQLTSQGGFQRTWDAKEEMWSFEQLEAFVASDASSVVEHTKKVIILEDNDVLHLKGGGYGIFNSQADDIDTAVPRSLLSLNMRIDDIMKGGYEHYMQKEIHEQPESLTQTMRGRLRLPQTGSSDPYLQSRIKCGGLFDYMPTIKRSRRIMFVGCGTSFHACLAARQTVEEMTELPVTLELASDLMDRKCPIFRDDTCVFVSQSGETADTLLALNYAKSSGALCVGITNVVGSAISRETDCGIHLNAGYEIGVASTKAYTSQILAITMMALVISEDSIAKRSKRDAIMDHMLALPNKIREVLKLDEDMKTLADELKEIQSLLFFGRGFNYATVMEAALKVKEVALIHSEGILAGEMKHGPLALVDENLPLIVIATQDGMYNKMKSVIQQLKARNGQLIIVCNSGDEHLKKLFSDSCKLIEVPKTSDWLQPIVNIVPLQLLSYHLTVLRGFNVDQPRNLAKSVTVTEE